MSSLKFVGRSKEINELENLLRKKTASLLVIRGRRRIGKSRLVQEFAEKKSGPSLFLSFAGLPPDENANAQDQRDHFARQLVAQLKIPKPATDDWYNLLLSLAKEVFQVAQSSQSSQKRIIILFDEISWMAMGDSNFLPQLKSVWDDYFSKTSKLMLFLCGSVSAWIDKNILSSTGFFGRINHIISLDELSLKESLELLSKAGFIGSLLEKLLILSISGGIPWYIELLSQARSADEAVMKTCFSKDGILVEEFDRIFHDLFGRRSEIYISIIRTLVSSGKTHREIATEINYPSGGVLSEYLNDLVLSGFLSMDPCGAFKKILKNNLSGRSANYRLRDNYLRFYLKYIEPNLSKIKNGLLEKTSLSSLRNFNALVGLQFENLVLHNRDLIYQSLGLQPQDILFAGPYIQRSTSRSSGCQIDLLIQTRLSVLYLCEIKINFGEKPLGIGVVTEVQEKIKALTNPKNSALVPVLIYFGELSSVLEESEYFLHLIDLQCLLTEHDL